MKQILLIILTCFSLASFSQPLIGIISSSQNNATTNVAADLNAKVYAYYQLNESSGSLIDAMGNNAGTNAGAVANQSAKFSTGYNFDTETDWLEFPYTTLPLSENRAISLWFKPNAINVSYILANEVTSAFAAKFDLEVSISNGLVMVNNNDAGSEILTSTAGSLITTTGVWYNVIVNMPTATQAAKIYLNGSDVTSSTDTWSGTKRTSDAQWIIGNSYYGASAGNIVVDAVGYYNGEITIDEASYIWNGGTGRTYPF